MLSDVFEYAKYNDIDGIFEPRPRGTIIRSVGTGEKEIDGSGLDTPISIEACAKCEEPNSVFILEKTRVSRFNPSSGTTTTVIEAADLDQDCRWQTMSANGKQKTVCEPLEGTGFGTLLHDNKEFMFIARKSRTVHEIVAITNLDQPANRGAVLDNDGCQKCVKAKSKGHCLDTSNKYIRMRARCAKTCGFTDFGKAEVLWTYTVDTAHFEGSDTAQDEGPYGSPDGPQGAPTSVSDVVPKMVDGNLVLFASIVRTAVVQNDESDDDDDFSAVQETLGVIRITGLDLEPKRKKELFQTPWARIQTTP
jgi:hypothetical protein